MRVSLLFLGCRFFKVFVIPVKFISPNSFKFISDSWFPRPTAVRGEGARGNRDEPTYGNIKDRRRGTVARLPLLLVVALIIFLPYSLHSAEPEPIDCSNLLMLLNMSLKIMIEGEPSTPQVIRSINNALIPGDLGNLHKNSYDLLLRYYNLTTSIINETLTKEEAQKALGELTELYSRLPEVVNQYMSKLLTCVHDPALGNDLRNSISLSINKIVSELIPYLTRVLFSKYFVLDSLVNIELSKDTYTSGELIEFEVILRNPSLTLSSASLHTWPDLRFLGYANISQLSSNRYAGSLRTPSVKLIKTLTKQESTLVLVITVRNVSSNENYTNYKLLKVIYKVPKVGVECPSEVFRGDSVELSIYSDNYYNATIKLNDLLLSNVSLAPGLTQYYINTSALNITVGVNIIEILVDPTQDSIGLRLTKPLMILPKVPKVKVIIPETSFTSDGFVTITLINEDPEETQLNVKVYVSGLLREEYSLSDILVIKVFTNMFPAFFTDLSIVVESPQHGKEPYFYEDSVLVVNPLTTLLTGLTSVFMVVLISDREKRFIVFIRGLTGKEKVSLRKIVRELSSYLVLPYVISSRIADLYYATLRRLGIPLPEVTETLREHFTRLNLSSFLRSIMWRFLVITEKDLYSREKQDYQEALKLAEEAVKNEN